MSSGHSKDAPDNTGGNATTTNKLLNKHQENELGQENKSVQMSIVSDEVNYLIFR
jgi:hypothetical protein